jgi:peptide/nickel transport system permease protein
MARYILTRTFYSLITLWLLVTIVFGMVRLTGDPVKMYGEVGADKVYLDELRRRWGLDKALYVQYFSFMAGLVQGNFG